MTDLREEKKERNRAGGPAYLESRASKRNERVASRTFTATDRLLILDIWERSEIGAPQFGELLGLTSHTLYQWRRRFEEDGPAGLEDHPRGSRQGKTRLPEPTRRAILMLKRRRPDWGVDRIRDVLMRSQGYPASSGAIQRLLLSQGYEVAAVATAPHPPKRAHRFERARANQMWQTDLFTFLLPRENRRLYLVVFMDDRSRFVVSHALSASSGGSLVREALEAGIVKHGPPEEVLTDNGPQYHTWRGTSSFTKLLRKRGIRHILSRPKHPQTLGKVERFWQTLWKECLESAVLRDLDDTRHRVGHFIDYYNFQRTHQGLDGLVPADRFFDAESAVRKTLETRVAQNALELAQQGEPRRRFYLTGQVDGQAISLHGEDGKVILKRDESEREEIELASVPAKEANDDDD
jgi:transposase InsO family protein